MRKLIILFVVVVAGAWLVEDAEQNLRAHQQPEFRMEGSMVLGAKDSVRSVSVPKGK